MTLHLVRKQHVLVVCCLLFEADRLDTEQDKTLQLYLLDADTFGETIRVSATSFAGGLRLG